MMAELAPPWGKASPWGKFGHPSGKFGKGTVLVLLYSQTSVVGIAKGQENVTALTFHMDYPSWFFGIQINQK